jgi:hypothetical protein
LTKMQSLLRRFDLEDVLLQKDERDPVTVQQTFERILDTPWDWDRINAQIEEASDQQIEFLKGSSSGAAGGLAEQRKRRSLLENA